MKINLNSHPSFIAKSLEGIEYGFGLYCASEQLGAKHFNFIQSCVEKGNNFLKKHNLLKAQEHDKKFIDNSLDNIQYIQMKFPQFSKDLEFQLNIDTNFNKVLKKFSSLSYIGSDNRDFMINMFSPFDNALYSKKREETTIVISSKMYGQLFESLSASIPENKRLDFILFHELGHYIENHCEQENGSYMHTLIETVRDIKELTYAGLIKEHDDYSIVDKNILTSLSRIPSEIYADTAALLLMRNKYIENGTFDKKEMLNIVQHVQNARTEENFEKLSIDQVDDILPRFTHKTSIVMDLIYDKFKQMDTKSLNLDEINSICCEVKEAGMARVFHTLLKSNPIFIDQVDVLASTQFDGSKYSIKKDDFKQTAKELASQIKQLVGDKWINDLDLKIQQAQPHKQLLGSRIIFNLGFNEIDTKGNINILDSINVIEKIAMMRQNTTHKAHIKP
jgi:hypothetical protein